MSTLTPKGQVLAHLRTVPTAEGGLAFARASETPDEDSRFQISLSLPSPAAMAGYWAAQPPGASTCGSDGGGAFGASGAAAKTVKIAVPILTFEDDEVFIKMSPAIQRTFHNADEWATFKNDCELSFVVEDATGRQVSFFPDLISGCTYSGQARPSTGVAQRIGSVEGENRSRVNAAEDELGQALVRLVAEEEGVSVADVMLRPDLRQIFDVTATPSDAAKVEFDAVLAVKKSGQVIWWAGAHRVEMNSFAAVKQLKDAETELLDFAKDTIRFPKLKELAGVQFLKKAVYAEHYQFDPANFERFKETCKMNDVLLVKQGGDRLVKVSALPKPGSHSVRRSLPLRPGRMLGWR